MSFGFAKQVTEADYQTVMATNPSIRIKNVCKFNWVRNRVEQVNYNDATESGSCLLLLSRVKQARRVYPLLTEAEWEYACRAGSVYLLSFGDDSF